MTDWHRWDGPDLLLDVRVQPRASRDAFVPEPGRLRIRTTAPPVDGAANEHLCRWLAKEFGVGASAGDAHANDSADSIATSNADARSRRIPR